ncbi:MAG: glycosyltransferase family 9 protein [bacterium]
MTEKLLCIQLKQLGDVLMITPAIRSLAAANPESAIHVLTQKPADDIFKYSPYIQKTILYPGTENPRKIFSLIRSLRKERYTMVIDFHGLPITALLSRLSGAPIRIGFKKPGRSGFYTHAVEPAAGVSYSPLKMARLLTVLRISKVDPGLDFFPGPEDEVAVDKILKQIKPDPHKLLVSISPVSRREYKVWPPEYFAEICDFLVDRCGAQILFLWGPGEYPFIQAVRDKMRQPSLPDYDIPTIRETVALLKRVDLHIGNDNGPMHFAISAGVPTVAIFGKPLLRNWSPPDQDRHLAVEFDPGCKEQCHYPKCGLECIRQVSVASVLDKVKIQLEALTPGEHRH